MELSFYKDYKKCTQLSNRFVEFHREMGKDEKRIAFYEMKMKDILFSYPQKRFEYEKDFLLYRNPFPLDLAFQKTKVIFSDLEVERFCGFSYDDILLFIEKINESPRIIWHDANELADEALPLIKIVRMLEFWKLEENSTLKENPIIKTEENIFLIFNVDYLIQYNHLVLAEKFYKDKENGFIRQKMSLWFEREIGRIFQGVFGKRSLTNAWVIDKYNKSIEEIDVLAWSKDKKTIFIVECKTNFMKTGKEIQTQRRIFKKPTEQLNRKKDVIEFSIGKDQKIWFRKEGCESFPKDVEIIKIFVSLEEAWDSFYKSESIEKNDIVIFSWGILKLFTNIFDDKEFFFINFFKQVLKANFLNSKDFVDGEFLVSKYLYNLDINKNGVPDIIINAENQRVIRAVEAKGLFRSLNKDILPLLEQLEVNYKGGVFDQTLFDSIKKRLNSKSNENTPKESKGFAK